MLSNDRIPLVLFFGSIRAGEYEPLAHADRQVGLLRDSENYYARYIPSGLAVLAEIPFRTGADEICAHVEQIREEWDVISLPVLGEWHIELAAEVARRLGYPALDEQTVLAVRNKTAMRDRLVRTLAADCTSRYAGVANLHEALQFADDVGYPVVLKPAQLYHSLHVTFCADAPALRTAFMKLTANLLGHPHGPRAGLPPLQIEEYMRGSDHSVDVIAITGAMHPTPVVDVITTATLGGSDFGHFARFSPSVLDMGEQQMLQDLAVRVTEAIGIRTGAAHVEMIWTERGPRVVEVGARPGNNRHFLLDEGRGIDLVGGYVAALSGLVPNLTPTRNRQVAVVTPYPVCVGKLRSYCDLELIESLPSFARLSLRARPGDHIGTPLDGAPAPLVVQLSTADAATLHGDIQRLWDLRATVFEVANDG